MNPAPAAPPAIVRERWIEAKAAWRAHLAGDEQAAAQTDLRIGLAATFTVNTLAPFVGAHLLSENYKPRIDIGPFGQLLQICHDPAAHFDADSDVIALLWRIEDLLGDDAAAFLNDEPGALQRSGEKLAALAAAISSLRTRFSKTIVVSVPPLPTTLAAGALELDNATRLGAFHRMVTTEFVALMSAIEGVQLLDLDAVQRHVGYVASFDSRQWYLYRQPFSDAFLHQAGIQLARLIIAGRRSPKKCIVLDCDNTLWGGVVGEDGLDGIAIGNEFPGSAFRDFQQLLLRWRRQGIFLALLSKNNEADVWEVFDRHDAMALRRADISAWRIDWQPKAENIPAIAKSLNIGIDSLVFIDDNPMEISYMRQAQPAVTSILLPEDPADIVPALQGLLEFDRIEVTAEDRARVDMMRAEVDREALGAQLSKDQFLHALELKLELFRARPEDLGRVTQLINKTNQFNLTTVRRTLDETRALAASDDYRLYALTVADKFGVYGLTGVVIASISSDKLIWTIDTLLLSCRVLGRGVEAALVAGLAADAAAEGARELVGTFVPTNKNALAASFLPDQGFAADARGEWHLLLAKAPAWPAFIERIYRSSAAPTEAVRAA